MEVIQRSKKNFKMHYIFAFTKLNNIFIKASNLLKE